jgi:hypothetical protein
MNQDQKQPKESQPSATPVKENEENIHISQPHIQRAEGPFEHSGETSGWTKEEREEKEQQSE